MLKPQDIVVLLKVNNSPTWTYSQLAKSLHLSASEVHAALKRCEISRLYDSSSRKVLKSALLEFLVHGLKYVFPSQPGPLSRGIPTAHSAEPLKSLLLVAQDEAYIWATPTGDVRGQTIEPLYRSVPSAAQNDKQLYELLSLVDAIRLGKVREQRLAATQLEMRLKAQSTNQN